MLLGGGNPYEHGALIVVFQHGYEGLLSSRVLRVVNEHCGLYFGLTSLFCCTCWLNIQCIPLERGVGRNTRCGLHLCSSSQASMSDTHRLVVSPTVQEWGLPMVVLFIMLAASMASSLVGNISLNRGFLVAACSR